MRATRRGAIAASLCTTFLLTRSVWAWSPLERNHPEVEQGITAYEAGRYDDALSHFEKAQKELPNQSILEFDRGNALFKLGRLDEAKEAYQRAEQGGTQSLTEKDLYNLGNAWAEMGNRSEAIAAYRKALRLNPDDEAARHNLEVLLAQPNPLNPPSAPDAGEQDGGQRDGGQQDGGQPNGGQGGGKDGGSSDGGQGSPGQDGGRADAGAREDRNGRADAASEQPPDAGMAPEEPQSEAGLDGGVSAELDRKDAERLLNAMGESEKNLQLWRFQQKKKTRRPNGKDW